MTVRSQGDMGSSEAEMAGSKGLREPESAVVMGARGVLGRIPLPEVIEPAEEADRPPPRMVRRMLLKLLLALDADTDAEDEVEEEAAAVEGIDCGAAKGERNRFGSMVATASVLR